MHFYSRPLLALLKSSQANHNSSSSLRHFHRNDKAVFIKFETVNAATSCPGMSPAIRLS